MLQHRYNLLHILILYIQRWPRLATQTNTYIYHEIVKLPCEVKPDTAKARYNNGVLEVVFKKKHPEKKGKKIKIE